MRDKQDSQTTDFLFNFHRNSKNIGSKVPSIPDDILAIPFKYLLPANIIRCKLVCRRFRSLIVEISIYKVLLDSICRRKRINNCMTLSQRVSENKSPKERSHYYKNRLYQYTNKFKSKFQDTTDAYIETYKSPLLK